MPAASDHARTDVWTSPETTMTGRTGPSVGNADACQIADLGDDRRAAAALGTDRPSGAVLHVTFRARCTVSPSGVTTHAQPVKAARVTLDIPRHLEESSAE